MKFKILTEEIYQVVKNDPKNYHRLFASFDEQTSEKMFVTVAAFVLDHLRERFTHPYQYAEELRLLLQFMEKSSRFNRMPILSEREQQSLLDAALDLEKGILFSQVTQNFGLNRNEAAFLARKLVPIVLFVLGKKLSEKNGPTRLLLALGVERDWFFLNVEAFLSIRRGEDFPGQEPMLFTKKQVPTRN